LKKKAEQKALQMKIPAVMAVTDRTTDIITEVNSVLIAHAQATDMKVMSVLTVLRVIAMEMVNAHNVRVLTLMLKVVNNALIVHVLLIIAKVVIREVSVVLA
jgi:hypothetical protein